MPKSPLISKLGNNYDIIKIVISYLSFYEFNEENYLFCSICQDNVITNKFEDNIFAILKFESLCYYPSNKKQKYIKQLICKTCDKKLQNINGMPYLATKRAIIKKHNDIIFDTCEQIINNKMPTSNKYNYIIYSIIQSTTLIFNNIIMFLSKHNVFYYKKHNGLFFLLFCMIDIVIGIVYILTCVFPVMDSKITKYKKHKICYVMLNFLFIFGSGIFLQFFNIYTIPNSVLVIYTLLGIIIFYYSLYVMHKKIYKI